MSFYSLCKLLIIVIVIMTVGWLMSSGWLVMCAVRAIILIVMNCLIKFVMMIVCLFFIFITC